MNKKVEKKDNSYVISQKYNKNIDKVFITNQLVIAILFSYYLERIAGLQEVSALFSKCGRP